MTEFRFSSLRPLSVPLSRHFGADVSLETSLRANWRPLSRHHTYQRAAGRHNLPESQIAKTSCLQRPSVAIAHGQKWLQIFTPPPRTYRSDCAHAHPTPVDANRHLCTDFEPFLLTRRASRIAENTVSDRNAGCFSLPIETLWHFPANFGRSGGCNIPRKFGEVEIAEIEFLHPIGSCVPLQGCVDCLQCPRENCLSLR